MALNADALVRPVRSCASSSTAPFLLRSRLEAIFLLRTIDHDGPVTLGLLLLDLDGVLRHFDPLLVASIEDRHGIARGRLEEVAFADPQITAVTTGRLSRADWIRGIGVRVGSPAAADEWGRQEPRADEELLGLVDEVRDRGLPVAILTNGTDTIPAELAAAGIDVRVDRIFNSAEIGHAKPDPRSFQHVLDAMAVPPDQVLFVDDSPAKLAGAAELGLHTHHHDGAAGLRAALARFDPAPLA